MSQHIVAFVDLLGFGEALEASNQEKLGEILKLLLYFRAFVRTYGEIPSSRPEGFYPEVSTFSDHIVFSLPVNKHTWVLRIMAMNFMVTTFARLALKARFLIRGAISQGSLYHDNGVVFGPALVRAANLESKVAVYPRVIVDPDVLVRGRNGFPSTHYFRDRDGLP